MNPTFETTPLERGSEAAQALQVILNNYRDKRVLVVGIPGAGKSTLIKHIPGAIDMDTVLIPQLSTEERRRVFQKSIDGLDESNEELRKLFAERVLVEPGRPQFSTVVIPSDVIVYLKIDDELLKERLLSRLTDGDRPQEYAYVKNIEQILEASIQKALQESVIVETFEMKKGLHDQ